MSRASPLPVIDAVTYDGHVGVPPSATFEWAPKRQSTPCSLSRTKRPSLRDSRRSEPKTSPVSGSTCASDADCVQGPLEGFCITRDDASGSACGYPARRDTGSTNTCDGATYGQCQTSQDCPTGLFCGSFALELVRCGRPGHLPRAICTGLHHRRRLLARPRQHLSDLRRWKHSSERWRLLSGLRLSGRAMRRWQHRVRRRLQ